jgi:ankyrin repeat protein
VTLTLAAGCRVLPWGGHSRGAENDALLAAIRLGDEEGVTRSLAAGANPNAQFGEFKTPALMHAVLAGNTNILETLVARGADVNARTAIRETPLMWAASQGRMDVVRFLLDHGAKVGMIDVAGQSAIHKARDAGHTEIADLLKQRLKAAVNAP